MSEIEEMPLYNETLRAVVEDLYAPVMLLGEDRIIVYQNHIMTETFGELLGQNISFLLDKDERARLEAENPFDGEGWIQIETVLADVTYDLFAARVQGANSDPYTVVMLHDISEEKYLEERLASNLRKLQRETKIAQQIQKSILPGDAEYWNAVRLNSVYLPADDLGGDVFDIVQLSEDETLLYIADVSGHGVQASLLTMFIREKIRAEVRAASNGLEDLIAELLKGFVALDIDAMMYFSILLCKYSKSQGELAITNAGHNCYPLVIRGGGRVEEIPVRGMPISKISESSNYEEEIIGLHTGDRLILYTDGVIEEYSKTEKKIFGAEGVRRVAEANYTLDGHALVQKIIDEANKYTMVAAKDDRTILVADML